MATIKSHSASMESDTDTCFAAPYRTATTHHPVGLDEEYEGWRQAQGIGDIEPRPTRGYVSHGALHATATVEGDGAMLENSVPRCCSLLVHCRKNPKPFRLSSDPDSKHELAAIESNMPSIFPKLQISLTTLVGARHRRYSCNIAKALDTIATGLSSAALSR